MSPPFGPGFDAKIALSEWQQYQVLTDNPNERRKKSDIRAEHVTYVFSHFMSQPIQD